MDASLHRQALDLPAPERLQLLEELWDSLCKEVETLPLTEEQRQELDARIEDIARNPEAGRPWSEVRRDLESRRR